VKFNDAVTTIGTVPDLRRVSSAHVVDYRNLTEPEIKEALIKVKPQYLHYETVHESLEKAFYGIDNGDLRVLNPIIIRDILINEDGYILSASQTEEKVMSFEQKIVNTSNEIDISDLASRANPQRKKDIELYYFVLGVAWEYEDSKSPDEVNLLRKLRSKLNINEFEHAVLEAKMGKYPKQNNDIHTRGEIREARRFLQSLGILFPIRDKGGTDLDVIPEEIAEVIKKALGIEIKTPNYNILIRHKLIYKKNYLRAALEKSNVPFNSGDNIEILTEKVIQNIQPSNLLGIGLGKEILYQWCLELNLPVSGTKQERIDRIISYYDSLRQTDPKPEDERANWYEMYEALGIRDYTLLRAHNIISKDIEVESKFEEATAYLFQNKLNHTPLKQVGSNHPDGILSIKDMYVMWDNKSKESPGLVDLKDHIKQFRDYMDKSDKPVPIFLVIAPGFTEGSELLALQYTSEHLNRNIVLISAEELKSLADEWSCLENKRHDEPFPLGLLARAGRFNIKLLGSFKGNK
jgi:hypothetical protein